MVESIGILVVSPVNREILLASPIGNRCRAGDTFELPSTEDPATLRVGESGAVYFAVNGQTYGPAGDTGAVTSNLALSVDNLTSSYQVADIARDADLERVVAELNSGVTVTD